LHPEQWPFQGRSSVEDIGAAYVVKDSSRQKSPPALGGQVAHQGCGAADRSQRREVAVALRTP
jgi:hypothetical protein